MVRRVFGWGIFALLSGMYVYMVVAAVGNVLLFPQSMRAFGFEVNALGWFWMWVGVALPVLGYLVALLVGRGRAGGARLLILATALAIVAALQLEISLLVPVTSFLV